MIAITIDDVTVNEADGTASFAVTLSNPSASSITLTLATANGSASPTTYPSASTLGRWRSRGDSVRREVERWIADTSADDSAPGQVAVPGT